jgi:hypothetical protein
MLQYSSSYILQEGCGVRNCKRCFKKGMATAHFAEAAGRGNFYQIQGQRGSRWRQGREYHCFLN